TGACRTTSSARSASCATRTCRRASWSGSATAAERVVAGRALATLLALTACAAPATAPSAEPVASGPPAPTLSRVSGTPARREEAAIEIAFDEAHAAELISPVPAEIDFATDSLLCVYLGERPTG